MGSNPRWLVSLEEEQVRTREQKEDHVKTLGEDSLFKSRQGDRGYNPTMNLERGKLAILCEQ